MSSIQVPNLDDLEGETAAVDFKASFDPSSKQDWCELIKDIMAMSNSGGGTIVVGVADDGSFSNFDIQGLLAVDPADVTNRIYGYTDQHFSAFEIVERIRFGRPVAVIGVGISRIPIVFTAHGGYAVAGGQKAAFVRGSVYFRHGAKSEPGTTDDLRLALERELEFVKAFWMEGIGKVVAAPTGSTVQIISGAVVLRDSPDAMEIRLTSVADAPSLGIETVALRDVPDATAVRLTNDPSAPTLNVMQADMLYPYRQKELSKRLAECLDGRIGVSSHDLQCVRRAHNVDDNPMLSYAARHSPRKYTEAYVDWLVDQYSADSAFFEKAREVVRSKSL